jgi:FAD/FMN-containing dehydrogenase
VAASLKLRCRAAASKARNVPSGGSLLTRCILDANRNAAYESFPVLIWSDPAADEANVAWTREMYAVLRPFAMGGVYVNNLGDEGHERVKAAYGENYDRLVTLKRKFDPDNLFRLNQNVHP